MSALPIVALLLVRSIFSLSDGWVPCPIDLRSGSVLRMPLGKAYTPRFSTNAPLVLPSTIGALPRLNCVGSPEGVMPGVPGQTCVDTATNNLYIKMGGNQLIGWYLHGTGEPGAGQAGHYLTSGDPNGTIAATAPAIAYSNNGSLWFKTGAGATNTGWILIVGDGS